MNNAIEAAVKFLNDANLVRVKRDPATKRVIRVEADATPKTLAPVAAPAPVPVPTLESARTFLAALRNAGKRPNAIGVMVNAVDPRADEAAAVAAFAGYSNGKPHGLQRDQAVMTAQRMVKAAEGKIDTRAKVAPTLRGWDAAHNGAEVQRADRAARLKIAVALACDLRRCNTGSQLANLLRANGQNEEADAAAILSDDKARALALSLAALEDARVTELRA